MNAKEFFYHVAEMRECQKAYFKTRDGHILRAARKLEILVDAEINRIRAIVNEQPPQLAAPPSGHNEQPPEPTEQPSETTEQP